MFYQYGEKEISYLKQKDRRLGEAIDRIGMIERKTDSDLFSSVVHHIIGQQISTAAQRTIWQRMRTFSAKWNRRMDGRNDHDFLYAAAGYSKFW